MEFQIRKSIVPCGWRYPVGIIPALILGAGVACGPMDRWDLTYRIVRNAFKKTAERQRWTGKHIASRLAFFAAILFLAWLSGHLSQVSDKRDFAILALCAVALVFLVDFIFQLFVATYAAGEAATGETVRLKELYREGRRYEADWLHVARDVMNRWAGEVGDELGRTLPKERFGFESAGDEAGAEHGARAVLVGDERRRRIHLQLRKLRAILMRADNSNPDE